MRRAYRWWCRGFFKALGTFTGVMLFDHIILDGVCLKLTQTLYILLER